MRRKILISIVGIALFAVAIGFGLNNNIEALASHGGMGDEAKCECECPDGNGSCEGKDLCDCSSDWILYCDDVVVYC